MTLAFKFDLGHKVYPSTTLEAILSIELEKKRMYEPQL